MMALPEIKSVADLKGKTVGVTRFGSSTDFALRYLDAETTDSMPTRISTILQLGGMPELAAALSKRLIVAAPLSAPTHIRARAAGAQPLLDMAKAGVYFPHTAVITTAGLLKNQPRNGVEFFPGLFRRPATIRSGQDRRRRRSSRSTLAIPPKISSKPPINTPSTMWSARRIRIARGSSKRSS